MENVDNRTISKKHYSKIIPKLLFSKRAYEETIKIEDKKETLMIAHRGLSKIEKENTLPAFRLAGEHSYYGIECDIRKSKDGRFLVIHDDNMKRISGVKMAIGENTAEAIRNVPIRDILGNASERYTVPTLIEYIMSCDKHNKTSVIELKEEFEEEDIVEIARIIEGEGCLCSTVFIAFSERNLKLVRKILPDQPVQYLSAVFHPEIVEFLAENKYDLDLFHLELTKERLDLLKDKGIKVNVWTVDDIKLAEKYISWGVDYITTNILE